MTIFILCFCVSVLLPLLQCDNTTQPDAVATQLQFLINEEKDLRQKLQTRVQRLRNEAAALNATIGNFHLYFFEYVFVSVRMD